MSTITVRLGSNLAQLVRHYIELLCLGRDIGEDGRRTLAGFCITLQMAEPDVPRTPPLSPKQHDLLVFINDYIRSRGYAPNFQEMADAMGYRSLATIHEHLGNLQKKGYIRRGWNEARSIEIVNLSPDLQPV